MKAMNGRDLNEGDEVVLQLPTPLNKVRTGIIVGIGADDAMVAVLMPNRLLPVTLRTESLPILRADDAWYGFTTSYPHETAPPAGPTGDGQAEDPKPKVVVPPPDAPSPETAN